MRTETDIVFRLAGVQDPFASGNPYLKALMELPPKERRVVVRQVVLLCVAVRDLDPLGALELIATVSPYLEVTRL